MKMQEIQIICKSGNQSGSLAGNKLKANQQKKE